MSCLSVGLTFNKSKRLFDFSEDSGIKQEKVADGIVFWVKEFNREGRVSMQRLAMYNVLNDEVSYCRYIPGPIPKTYIPYSALGNFEDGSTFTLRLMDNLVHVDKVQQQYGLKMRNCAAGKFLVPSGRHCPSPPLIVNGKEWKYEDEGIAIDSDEVVVYPSSVYPLLKPGKNWSESGDKCEDIESQYTWDLTAVSDEPIEYTRVRKYNVSWKWEMIDDEYYITFETRLVADPRQPVQSRSPCVVSIFVDGRMKCGLGYISDTCQQPVRVSFCQEDLDFEFDATKARICMSVHLFNCDRTDLLIGPMILPRCFSNAKKDITYFMRSMIMAHLQVKMKTTGPIAPLINEFCEDPSLGRPETIAELITEQMNSQRCEGYGTTTLSGYSAPKEKRNYVNGSASKGVMTGELWVINTQCGSEEVTIQQERIVNSGTSGENHVFQLIALYSNEKVYDPFTTEHICPTDDEERIYQVYAWKRKE